ncbi:zinc finger protein 479-like [Ptychodera flava]|uniref:zinc finger protein 479-like n=1 Tax=Ptychodera flava TaxID=63121 RepID=UPI003969C2B8
MELLSSRGFIQSSRYATMNDLLFKQFGFQVLANNIHEENTDTYPILVQSVLRESDVEIWGGFCVHAYIVKLDFQKTPGQPEMCLAILLKNKYTPDVKRLEAPFKLQAYHLQWIQNVLDGDMDGMPVGDSKEIPFIAMYDAVELSDTERMTKDQISWKEMNLVQKSTMPVISGEQDTTVEEMETTSTVNQSALRVESHDLSPAGDAQICQEVPVNTVHMNNHSEVEPFLSDLRDDSQKMRIDGQNQDVKDVLEGIIKKSEDSYIPADVENIPHTDVETKIQSEKSRNDTDLTNENFVPGNTEEQIKIREEIESADSYNQSPMREKSHDASQPIMREISSSDGQLVQEEADLNKLLQKAHSDSYGSCEDDNMEQMNNNMGDSTRSEGTDNFPDSDFCLQKGDVEHCREEGVSDSNTAATKALDVTSELTETKEFLHSDAEGDSSNDDDASYHPEADSDSDEEYTPQTRKSNRRKAGSGKALKTRKKRKEKFQCADCGKMFRMEKRYNLHMELHKTEGPKKRRRKAKCDDCGRVFRRRGEYSEHMRKHRRDAKLQRNQCRICGTQHKTLKILEAHVSSEHPGEKPYACEICRKTFVKIESKYKHTREIHGDSMLQCDQCDMAFRSSGSLTLHKKTKHLPLELWNHACDVCSKRFPYKSMLQEHMKSHSDERNFHCQVCGKDFKYKGGYCIHVDNHEREKPYMCEHCGKSFRRRAHLEDHAAVHTKEKNFLCDYCGKSFSNKSNLYVHRRQHTGVRPVVCKICGQGFHRQRYLAKHMEKIHPNSMTQSNDIGTHDNATTDAVSQIL